MSATSVSLAEPPGWRDVPTSYVGTVEPNYYCRHWNEKRQKYCSARAGQGTDHPGVGRCKNGGGMTPLKTGIYSRIQRPRIRELIQYMEEHGTTDTMPELHAARALFVDWIERYDEWKDAFLAWHASFATGAAAEKPRKVMDIAEGRALLDVISKILERRERTNLAKSVTAENFSRVMEAMSEVVEAATDALHLPHDARAAYLARIYDGWGRISVA